MAKIYTKQGDQGMSVLFNGQRVPKHHLRLETYGTVDELNSHLGLALCTCTNDALRVQLQQLQVQLFSLGADLATPAGAANEHKVRRIGAAEATALEQQIDAATDRLPPLKNFILPGGCATACHLHVARTVCRRAERLLVAHEQTHPKDSTGIYPLIYLNRLSDLLFTLARLANHLAAVGEFEWNPRS